MTVHAFFEGAPGPCNILGMELHYVTNEGRLPQGCRRHTPSVGWWPSRVAYMSGLEGVACFNKPTRFTVEDRLGQVQYHETRLQACEAWDKEHR